ncbi:hypothetical protein [Streptomyces marianii]|uniref:Uncharacterized protein n=1 Tax=Streptomyces marianii TaxID=1817406 RepID=A0A5R9DSC7_9ACTN|nr:hypothetical protein [Streptomyces marianii]TLQ39409.1 hypothetical protein FEF34_39205 [Streptomyces marianii]
MLQLPLAQEIDKEIYSPHEFHNRVRKALLTAVELRKSHFGGVITAREVNTLTHEHMALAARRINERPPTVKSNASPTAQLITDFLHAFRTAQPSGRSRSVHQPPWLAGFSEDLQQAIPIAFDAFWNEFDGLPTTELIDALDARQMTAIARRVRPGGRMATRVSTRAEFLVRHLLCVIRDAQPEATAVTSPSAVPAQSVQPKPTDAATLTEAVTAAISAAAQSKTPTIVVLNFPQ